MLQSIITFLYHIITIYVLGTVVALVSLDKSAAFAMVNHNLLLDKLNKEFVTIGAAKDWIGSYLIARQFFARVGPSSSNMCSTSAVVCQGSVLGPALFTAYVSPIGSLRKSRN